MFALGDHLVGAFVIIAIAVASAILCLMFAYRFEQKKTPEGHQAACMFLIAVFACILLALFSPLIAQALHLP
jgi:hypothetical protein